MMNADLKEVSKKVVEKVKARPNSVNQNTSKKR